MGTAAEKNRQLGLFPALLLSGILGVSLEGSPRSRSLSVQEEILISRECGGDTFQLISHRSSVGDTADILNIYHSLKVKHLESGNVAWSLSHSGAGRFALPQWFGDISCMAGTGELFVLVLTQRPPDFSGQIFRLNDGRDKRAEKKGSAVLGIAGAELGEREELTFRGSLGLGSVTVKGVSLVMMGTRGLVHVEADIAGAYSGRLIFLDLSAGSASEVKLKRGETPKVRQAGAPVFFPRRWVSTPVPWDLMEVESSERVPVRKEDRWFSCSDLRDCAAVQDSCGRFVGVNHEAVKNFNAWVERSSGSDCLLAPVGTSTCQQVLGCFDGKCDVRPENDDPEVECGL